MNKSMNIFVTVPAIITFYLFVWLLFEIIFSFYPYGMLVDTLRLTLPLISIAFALGMNQNIWKLFFIVVALTWLLYYGVPIIMSWI